MENARIRFINIEPDETLIRELNSHGLKVNFNREEDYVEVKAFIEPQFILSFISNLDLNTALEIVRIILNVIELLRRREPERRHGIHITIDGEMKNIQVIYTRDGDIKITIEK